MDACRLNPPHGGERKTATSPRNPLVLQQFSRIGVRLVIERLRYVAESTESRIM